MERRFGWTTGLIGHLGCGSDDGLQCCRRPWRVARVTAGILSAVVMMVVAVRGGALQKILPTSRRLRLRVVGGGGEGS